MAEEITLLPAVITAGGRIDGEYAAAAGTDLKALVPFGGRPVAAHVADALRRSGRVSRVVVVGPAERLRAAGINADEFVEEGDSGPENFRRGLSAVREIAEVRGDGRALLCATDLAFLEDATVRWFVDHAPRDGDVVYPVVTAETYEAAFPGSPNTFAPLADGRFTGGSLQVVRPAVVLDNLPLIRAAFDARKSQLAMARLLGLGMTLKFLTRRLTVADAEAHVSRIIGCKCAAMWVRDDAPALAGPRLCADIDGLADYEYSRRRWEEMYGAATTAA